MSFDNKVVLITGGTHGIGRVLARQLVQAGARVIVSGRSAEKAESVCQELGDSVSFIACDISQQAQVESLFEQIRERFGRLDLAVNNAGITASRGVVRALDLNNWRQVVDINLTGTLMCMQQQLRLIGRQSGGAIVNVSSCAGVTPIPGQAAYSASKAALNCLTQVAAIEAAVDSDEAFAVRINAVAPGPTLGGMNTPERLAANPEATRQKLAVTAMKRMADPEEVVAAILFLLSPASSYITGTVLDVDGGYSSGKFS